MHRLSCKWQKTTLLRGWLLHDCNQPYLLSSWSLTGKEDKKDYSDFEVIIFYKTKYLDILEVLERPFCYSSNIFLKRMESVISLTTVFLQNLFCKLIILHGNRNQCYFQYVLNIWFTYEICICIHMLFSEKAVVDANLSLNISNCTVA